MFKSLLKAPNLIILRQPCQKCTNLRKSPFRAYSQDPGEQMRQANKKRLRSTLYYFTATGVVTLGMSYAAVPLYRMFCQAYSYGGTTVEGHDSSKVESMQADRNRPIRVRFNADKAANMRWNFSPQQTEITVFPGETALAFYTAKNPTDCSVVGISTYNVIPFEAGQYFNKIQCFCFEEQMLNPHEQVENYIAACFKRIPLGGYFLKVDMPVFFYIDPEFTEDPYLENCKEITLSYTFFEAKDGFKIPVPQYTK